MIASCPFQLLSHLMGILLPFKCLQHLDNKALSIPFCFPFYFLFFILCVSVLNLMYVDHVCLMPMDIRRGCQVSWNPLELELLWMVVSSHVGAGN